MQAFHPESARLMTTSSLPWGRASVPEPFLQQSLEGVGASPQQNLALANEQLVVIAG